MDRKFLPPKSIGYLNIKKKYRCPTRFPISSLMTLQGKRTRIVSHAVFSENKQVTIFCQLLLLSATGIARAMSHRKFPFPQHFAATSLEGPIFSAKTSTGCSTLPSKPALQSVQKMQLNTCLHQGIRPYGY